MTGAPMSWDRDFGTTYSIQPNSSGQLYAWFNSNFAQTSFTYPRQPTDAFNYYHGRDFHVTVRYTLGGLACESTVTGYPGPRLFPLSATNDGLFSLDARAVGWDGPSSSFRADALNLVTFTVFDASNNMVHYQREGQAPYCIFGDNGTNCTARRVYVDRWSNGAIITPGNYTIHIIARDKSDAQYATHVLFNLVIPVSNTPTVTSTSTLTYTPLPTFTPVDTSTPLPTRTRTPIPPPTAIPTITPIPSETLVPTRTLTSPPSATPTTCTTPIEMGGCN